MELALNVPKLNPDPGARLPQSGSHRDLAEAPFIAGLIVRSWPSEVFRAPGVDAVLVGPLRVRAKCDLWDKGGDKPAVVRCMMCDINGLAG